MANYTISLDLKKLNGATLRQLTGRTGQPKNCIIIPVDDNPSMVIGEKGIYLNATAYELEHPKYDDTHMVKPSLPKEVRERMTEEERRAIPILGNMRPIKPREMQPEGQPIAADQLGQQQDDDLPF